MPDDRPDPDHGTTYQADQPQELSVRELDDPHPERLPHDHPQRVTILAAHRAALAAGRDTYLDPATGYSVFTAAYLARRGYCCDSGCRHCPYL